MALYRIGELAQRAGVSAPTLRYYENTGLFEETTRSPSGYRLYDSAAEAKLRFIVRAKRLGLSLDEIRDLVAIWNGGKCATTREQLRHLVAHKITQIRRQLEEAATFERQLEEVYTTLLDDGRRQPECSEDCGCVPALPHVGRVRLDDELRLIATNECTCGGGCGAAGCACGCQCCHGLTG